MKNRHASCTECYSIGNDFLTTIACVVPSRTKHLPDVIGRVKHAAIVLHRRLVLDAILRDLLCYLWRVGLAATSPMRWEAWWVTCPWVPHEDAPCIANCGQIRVLQNVEMRSQDECCFCWQCSWWLSSECGCNASVWLDDDWARGHVLSFVWRLVLVETRRSMSRNSWCIPTWWLNDCWWWLRSKQRKIG